MAEVAVFGTVAADVVIRVPAVPLQGAQIVGEALGWRLGGSSANLACGLAAAGHDVQLIGPAGTDSMAEALLGELGRRGVRTHRVLRVDAPSPRALILLDAAGERTIISIERGSATDALPITDPPGVASADCVYVESYERFSRVIADRCPDALLVAPPPLSGHRRWPADILIGSEGQYPATWATDPFESARAVAGPRLEWLIVTRGSRGADAYGLGGRHHVPGRATTPVDATGAGDAFAAGVIAGRLADLDIEEAMALGAAQGAAAVEVLQSVPPDWIESVDPI